MTMNPQPQDTHRPAALLQRQRQAFDALPFPDLAQRKAKLRRLVAALQRHQSAIVECVNADFGVRSPSETRLVEVLGPVLHARHALSRLRRWMKPRRRSTELLFLTNQAWVEAQPKGVVGIIGPWNFPFYLTVGPLITALAAGNRAVIKTSEFAPRSSALLRQILAECFDEDEVAVCEGGPEVAQAFTRLPFDHLVFTGSPKVGRDVMRAAADHLTPVTLELGGKSPAIVGPGADLRDAARRIAQHRPVRVLTTFLGAHALPPEYAGRHDDYIADCQGGIDRWNKVIEKAGINFKFTQPHKGFNRKIGEFGKTRISPDGRILSEAEWQAGQGEWLVNEDDYAFIHSLMKPCHNVGEYASWIAPPRVGINNQPADFEYVRIEHS